MNARLVQPRIAHMLEAIARMRSLIGARTVHDLAQDVHARAAFERYFEIVSEASRHIPDALKAAHAPDIPWKNVANLGNHLRHGYSGVDLEGLWNIYQDNIPALEAALVRLLHAVGPKDA